VRVAIVDDSDFFRSGLISLLETVGVEVTASVSSGDELWAAIRSELPDAVILDIKMPPTMQDEGIRVAIRLRQAYPGLGIVVFSAYSETNYASQLLKAIDGGIGYLLKDNVTNVSALMDALARVSAGGRAIDPSIVMPLLDRAMRTSPIKTLNDSECEILRLMAEGLSNRGIEQELHIASSTVENYVSSIFTKLGLKRADTNNNRVRAVLTFLRETAQG
jgi:DNA-binding NarL/FixJ family response regulator